MLAPSHDPTGALMPLARILLLAALCALVPAQALAYIDPGSGSIIFQVIIGGILAAGVTLKMYWGRFVRLFRGGRDADDAATDDR